MSRPLRVEFPGAIHHVTSRGHRREPIYRYDVDGQAQLSVLGQAMDRYDAQVLAYCMMGNHYHLVVHTRMANLSRLMRHLNGVYTQRFNRRHGLVGHLFQGRFKAILVDRDAYLLSLCRYVENNPVAAGLAGSAERWLWSSCRAHVMQAPTPSWLDSDGLHGFLLGRDVLSDADRRRAAAIYARMVREADDSDLWQKGLRQQVFLGGEEFVARTLQELARRPAQVMEVPKRQLRKPASLAEMMACGTDRAKAMRQAYAEGGFTMTEIAEHAGLSVSRVSRLIKGAEAKGKT